MSLQSLVLRHGRIEKRIAFASADAIPPEEFLGEPEKEQAAGFRFAEKRQGYLLGRLAAKRALGALLEEPDLRRIGVHSGVYGQPLVRHPRAESLEVSVSHSHGFAVALAYPAEYPLGIDLETIAGVSAAVVLGELGASPPELAWLASGGVDAATACCVLWGAREALGKALRIGLNSPLGILALSRIEERGAGNWFGRYLNFPRVQCLSQARNGRVLSLAMHGDAELSSPLAL